MSETAPPSLRQRALRLLAAGAAGGTVAGVVGGIGCGWVFGAGVVDEVAVAALVALAFFALGQLVHVAFADADSISVLVASLSSYAIRVAGLAAFAVSVTRWWPGSNLVAMGVIMVCVVVGWLACEIWVFQRLRIPAFDPPQAKTE